MAELGCAIILLYTVQSWYVLRLSILVKEIKTWKGYESTTSFVAFHLSPYVYMVDYSYPYTHA